MIRSSARYFYLGANTFISRTCFFNYTTASSMYGQWYTFSSEAHLWQQSFIGFDYLIIFSRLMPALLRNAAMYPSVHWFKWQFKCSRANAPDSNLILSHLAFSESTYHDSVSVHWIQEVGLYLVRPGVWPSTGQLLVGQFLVIVGKILIHSIANCGSVRTRLWSLSWFEWPTLLTNNQAIS